MRRLFWIGVLGLALRELASVYFIMPLPGSQRMPSLALAYLIYQWRWPSRAVLVLLLLLGLRPAWAAAGRWRWLVLASLLGATLIAYAVNFRMAADQIFKEPNVVQMEPAQRNHVALDRLVVGVELDGQARAYPLQFIGYHHQVRDTLGGREILVTYCTVCRTGRVFAPVVGGRSERFRLVGMDHFNAMFEDHTTRSWWRQANGEAVIGHLEGAKLPELASQQMTLERWLAAHPASLVMQADPSFVEEYAKDYGYEKGTSRKALTGTDTLSWRDKSWVLGVTSDGWSKAYDWNDLRRQRVINDLVGETPIVLALAADEASYYAYVRPDTGTRFTLRGDSLVSPASTFGLGGRGPTGALTPIGASQEFWHSWRTFQPKTERYQP